MGAAAGACFRTAGSFGAAVALAGVFLRLSLSFGPAASTTTPGNKNNTENAFLKTIKVAKVEVSRRNKRRSHHTIKDQNIIEDKKSGEFRLSHHVDLKTGLYKGRQVFEPKK